MMFAPRDFQLLIGVHTHGHITPPFAQSLAVLTGQLASWGVAHAVCIVQDAFVTSGRDRLAATMLAGEFTHLLMLDADLEFLPSDVGHLMAVGKPLVAGAYRRKEETGQFAVSFLGEAHEGAPWDGSVRAIQVDGVGTGFMLIAREVFERMAAEMPEIAFVEANDSGPAKARHAFFEQQIVTDENGERHRASEDILFCRRWRALGGEVWVLADLRLKHWGPYAWEGALTDAIRIVVAA